MSPRIRIGIIGVGEAGAAIATGLRTTGVQVFGVDVRADDPVVRARADAAGIQLVDGLESLAAQVEVIVCLTSAKFAVAIATEIAPFLTAAHLYSDWNSASPELKKRVGEVVAGSGASFADGAVMAAVLPHKHRVPVLLSGPGAEAFASALTGTGMRLEVIGVEPGQASAVKMFRSLLVKGLEALLLECAVGANAYGVTDRVLSSMNGSLPMDDWPELASYLLSRTLAHGERRAQELREVASTLEDVSVEPLLADAGARRLQWLADLGVQPAADSPYEEVLNLIEKARQRHVPGATIH
jgi:3-hydroxyisobutyrate dehydrogenase-like beta-hydroxyacid dehydrogenase